MQFLDKMIRHRACTLRDTAYALIKAEMDTDFEEQCQEISRTRKARKEKVAPVPGPFASLAEGANTATPQDTKVWLKWMYSYLEIYFTNMQLQGNGEASKSELKVAKAKNRKTGWSQGNIKNPAKKRKTIDTTENQSNDSSVANLNASDLTADESKTASSKDVKSTEVLEEVLEPEESQTSDAFDSQTEVESGTTSAEIPKKVVLIDIASLEKLLDTAVAKTDKWNLEKLLRLYSKLSKLIDRYLKLWDRSSLVEVTI